MDFLKSKTIILYLGVAGLIIALLVGLFSESGRFQVIAGALIFVSLAIIALGWAVYQRKT